MQKSIIDATSNPSQNGKDIRIAQLENELAKIHKDMFRIEEEQETLKEELQRSKEELQSGREELQSLNEELITINQERYSLIEQLNHANKFSDTIISLLHEPLLVLDKHLVIKRANILFTRFL